jgi:hypothetical protein
MAVVYYTYRRQQRVVAVATHFYTNTKPYLEREGFEGEAGWCTEEPDFIDNLYRLRDPSGSKAFADLPADMASDWFADGYDLTGDDREPSGRQYDIAFMAVVTARSNKAIMTLGVRERESGDMETKDLVLVYAPVSYFSKTAISTLLAMFRMRIQKYEAGEFTGPLWLVSGLASVHKIYDLPYVEPGRNPAATELKMARRLMDHGYAN